ncbi:unnamed protein product [Brugia pahangi]|uniref:Mediator of RNA polymerase II transcription subunit 20 n=1 Tax=Brugia pahangi TaxID=6280 RepID=A0A0N4SYT3_BRUPA|nr:unnamed protein product [Brugia pahangi]
MNVVLVVILNCEWYVEVNVLYCSDAAYGESRNSLVWLPEEEHMASTERTSLLTPSLSPYYKLLSPFLCAQLLTNTGTSIVKGGIQEVNDFFRRIIFKFTATESHFVISIGPRNGCIVCAARNA